jgi:hypothetical protein
MFNAILKFLRISNARDLDVAYDETIVMNDDVYIDGRVKNDIFVIECAHAPGTGFPFTFAECKAFLENGIVRNPYTNELFAREHVLAMIKFVNDFGENDEVEVDQIIIDMFNL